MPDVLSERTHLCVFLVWFGSSPLCWISLASRGSRFMAMWSWLSCSSRLYITWAGKGRVLRCKNSESYQRQLGESNCVIDAAHYWLCYFRPQINHKLILEVMQDALGDCVLLSQILELISNNLLTVWSFKNMKRSPEPVAPGRCSLLDWLIHHNTELQLQVSFHCSTWPAPARLTPATTNTKTFMKHSWILQAQPHCCNTINHTVRSDI